MGKSFFCRNLVINQKVNTQMLWEDRWRKNKSHYTLYLHYAKTIKMAGSQHFYLFFSKSVSKYNNDVLLKTTQNNFLSLEEKMKTIVQNTIPQLRVSMLTLAVKCFKLFILGQPEVLHINILTLSLHIRGNYRLIPNLKPHYLQSRWLIIISLQSSKHTNLSLSLMLTLLSYMCLANTLWAQTYCQCSSAPDFTWQSRQKINRCTYRTLNTRST